MDLHRTEPNHVQHFYNANGKHGHSRYYSVFRSSPHASHHRRIDRASVRFSRSGLGICSFSQSIMFPSRCHQCIVLVPHHRSHSLALVPLARHSGIAGSFTCTRTHEHRHRHIHQCTKHRVRERRAMPNVASFWCCYTIRRPIVCLCVPLHACNRDPRAKRWAPTDRVSRQEYVLVFVAETKFITASLFNEKQHKKIVLYLVLCGVFCSYSSQQSENTNYYYY